MAAVELTEKTFPMQHLKVLIAKLQSTATGDWVVINGYKGVIPLGGIGQATDHAHEEIAFTYGVATVDATITATATTINVTSATVTRVPPFYVLTANGGTSSEIFEVLSETDSTNATSTWTIRRGCLGTTASVHTATDVVSIMNILFTGVSCVGPHIWTLLPLPEESRAKVFA
jgi:hypothetical protein